MQPSWMFVPLPMRTASVSPRTNDGVEPDARVFGDRDVAQNVDAWGDEDRLVDEFRAERARIRLTVWVSKARRPSD